TVSRVSGLDQRRLDEVPDISPGRSALDDLRVLLRIVEIGADLVECLAVDDGRKERAEVCDVAHLHIAHHPDDAIADVGPERLRDVNAARRGTLLTLILERPARNGNRNLLRVS